MHIEIIAALCLLATAPYPDRDTPARYATCHEVASKAAHGGVDPVLMVALAVEESNLRADVVSSRGAVGPLQVMPEHWCGGAGCLDPVASGLRAVQGWRERYGSAWLCHYNAGNVCGDRSRRYARRIKRRAVSWRARLALAGVEERERGE